MRTKMTMTTTENINDIKNGHNNKNNYSSSNNDTNNNNDNNKKAAITCDETTEVLCMTVILRPTYGKRQISGETRLR